MTPLFLALPLPPNIANGRMHWRVKLNAKKAYWETLDMMRTLRQIPRPPAKPPARARITVTLYLYSAMDDDNAMSRFKYAGDWLVGNGYLPGDSRKELTWAGLPDQHIDRKNQRMEITITPEAPNDR